MHRAYTTEELRRAFAIAKKTANLDDNAFYAIVRTHKPAALLIHARTVLQHGSKRQRANIIAGREGILATVNRLQRRPQAA